MRPITPSKAKERQDDLKRKWGFNDPKANANIEKTHQEVLKMVSNNWERLNPAQKKHFEQKKEFEEQWKRGEIYTWQEYYGEKATDIKKESMESV